jgi:predicted transcriptional regulator
VARKLTDTVKLQVRLSERLRRRLEQAAKDNEQSMNTEIVSRLDASLQREDLEEMIARAVEDGLKAQQEVTEKRIAAQLSKSKRETPSKGEGSK